MAPIYLRVVLMKHLIDNYFSLRKTNHWLENFISMLIALTVKLKPFHIRRTA